MEAARTLFLTRGVQNVSIKEIAARAGVSQVTIYNYYGDKRSLAKAAFSFLIDHTMSEFDRILKSTMPFNEKIRVIMQQKGDLTSETFQSNFDQQAWNDSELRQVFGEAMQERAIALYRDFIELGKLEGKIDRTIPNDAALSYVMMSFELFQRPTFLAADPSYKIGMMKLFLYGLICGDERPDLPIIQDGEPEQF